MKPHRALEGNEVKSRKAYRYEEPEVYTLNEIDLSGTYSYASYLRWKFEERVELFRV